jgi:hypothetical protein
MTTCPLVSVLINNYNYARFVTDAIASVLNQTYTRREIIVVDDGSTDNSRDVIARFGDRVHLIAKDNGGQASAFNAGFAASKGEILCFLDSDDLFLPHKLARIVRMFTEHPDIGWFFDTPNWFGSSQVGPSPNPAACKVGNVDARKMLSRGEAPYIPAATSGLSFRRRTVERILPMPEVIRITSDNYLKLASLSIAEGWLSSETLSLQRIHGDNAYTNLRTDRERLFRRTELLTGICLQRNFPALTNFALSAVYHASVKLWTTGGIDPDLRLIVQSYLRSVGLLKWSTRFIKLAVVSAFRKFRRLGSSSPTQCRSGVPISTSS